MKSQLEQTTVRLSEIESQDAQTVSTSASSATAMRSKWQKERNKVEILVEQRAQFQAKIADLERGTQ